MRTHRSGSGGLRLNPRGGADLERGQEPVPVEVGLANHEVPIRRLVHRAVVDVESSTWSGVKDGYRVR